MSSTLRAQLSLLKVQFRQGFQLILHGFAAMPGKHGDDPNLPPAGCLHPLHGDMLLIDGDVGFLASIPLWLVTLLGSLMITVLAFIMILTVYGRFFKIYMYAALSPVALASFAGEGTSHFGKAFLRSYVGVCMEGAVIVLACIIFSAFSSSGTPVIDSSASVVTQVWSYLGEVVFNLLVLVGLVKSADHIAKEMLGL